ncbi:uncharacterized protein LOC120267394 [Dioscorea cayenensis subsp. rotundata]|uniref:Uncharacterized protein LOC120267394 n=1 Tax=Dioscorea cayennensis subsp. rotundata TaxID=55577 RepID=A0AB40BU42_DIOCR|nr:uncharacterized protein LOC120267394 [Dioscorea cayenensis subsp. rotundata]
MGIAPSRQRSAAAPPAPDKVYRNSQRAFQDSGEAITNKSRSRNMFEADVTKMWLGTRQYRTPGDKGMSQDIVPFGAKRLEQNIDVSMALALALSKTGKLQNIELIMNYGSMNGRSMSNITRLNSDGFPILSNLHIGEVSKGVQKLNKILNDHSDGLQFSRNSIDIGRELLRGAMDLEESLKMLVTLQEASDYMVGSNGRQVRLLKGKEDESSSSDKVHQKKQLDRPRFSFDVSPKYLCEMGRDNKKTNIEPKSIGCNIFCTKTDMQHTNTSEKPHRGETFSLLNGASTSKSNKLGGKGGPPSEKSTGQKVHKVTYSEKAVFRSDNANKVSGERGIRETNAAKNIESVSDNGKVNMGNLNHTENKKPASRLHAKIIKQIDMNNVNHEKETRAAKKKEERVEENRETDQHKFKERNRKPVHGVAQDVHTAPVATYYRHKEEVTNEEGDQKQKSSMKGNAVRLQNEDLKSKVKITVNRSEKETKPDAKSKQQYEEEKITDLKLKNLEKYPDETSTKKFSSNLTVLASHRCSTKANNTGQKENLKRIHNERAKLVKKASTFYEEGMKISNGGLDRKIFKTDSTTDQEKTKHSLQRTKIQNFVCIKSTEKPDVSQVVGKENEIDTPHENGQLLKQQSSVFQEQEQRCEDNDNKATEEKFIDLPENQENQFQQEMTCTSLSCGPLTDDCEKLRVTSNEATVENNSHGPTIRTVLQQLPDIPEKEDTEEMSFNIKENDHEGPTDSMQMQDTDFEHVKWQKQELSENIKEESLTEKGSPFKKMVVNNKNFLNTAQALFKLEIPIGILHASENAYPAEDSKGTLDCVYEVMRRKNRREESNFALRLSIAPIRERSLDDLIQELNGDLQNLKCPITKEGGDYDTAEMLHKMLARDIQNCNPDINCMWDLGWTMMLFADAEKDEVVRDVEKHILNMLINEFALDILNLNITV